MVLTPLPRQFSTAKVLLFLYTIFSLKFVGFVWLRRSVNERLSLPGNPQTFPMQRLNPVRMFIEDSTHFQVDEPFGIADAEWDSLTPNQGIVHLGEDHRPYTISMFHQLRCLNIIRKEIAGLQASGSVDPVVPTALSHHCVNYLRQAVLCRSDNELDIVLGKPRPSVYPNLYQCKDWSAVYEAVENNQKKSSQLY